MKIKLIALTILGLFGLFALQLSGSFVKAGDLKFPTPDGYVNDWEGIISNDDELNSSLQEFEKSTGVEIAVVTTPDFQDTYIEDYAVQLFETWKIGQAGEDNGVLVIVSSEQRESRIEVGYGLEGILTDATTGQIQDSEMIPYFQTGDYSTGINKGADAVMQAINGEYVPSDSSNTTDSGSWSIDIGGIFFFVVFFVGSILGSTKSWWLGGVLGAVIGLVIGIIWFSGWGIVAWSVGLGAIGLLIDYILSKMGFGKSGTRTGFWGFSSGRSSGGGFSFGGGSSGGGGSSRSW